MRTMSEIAKNALEETRMRRQRDRIGKYHGLSTGIGTLDRVSSGLKKGELVCIAARSAMGKTSLASCIAAHLALKENKSVLIYSGEMHAECYLYRIISAYAEIPAISLRDGELDTAEMDLFEKTIEEIACSKLHIADTPAIRVSKLREKCEKIKNADGLDLLIVDYLQLLSPEREYDTREEQVDEQVRNLKQLALSMDIPVIILSQLSRNLEWRADHRLMLGDFMEDSVANISDTVWILYRDAYYNKEGPDDDIMEVIVAKQYMGATSNQILSWDQECCRCSDYRFSTDSNGVTWKDIVSQFLHRMEELTETDAVGIDVEDRILIKEICGKDMTGVFELGNEDVRILIEAESPETFDDLVKICANAHGADICCTECSGGENDPLDEERKMAEEKMGYSVKLAWYKLNYPKEFYQAYFETYVCSAE